MPVSEQLLSIPHDLAADQFEIVLRRLADDLTYGSDPSRFVGAGVDYVQSRPFVIGDSVRRIDWRVTARTRRFHVKEYEATKRVPLFLLVDTSASMGVSSHGLSKHDAAVWIAGVLALVALRRRSPVAILSCGERTSHGAPTLSRGQVWKWIEHLREPSPDEQTRLADRVQQVEALAFHTSMVVVISDLHDPSALPAIRRIAQRHDTVVLQLMDPAEGGRLRAGFVRSREAETGRDFVSHSRSRFFGKGKKGKGGDGGHDLHAPLADSGADHIVVRTDEPIIPVLQRILGGHARTGRNAR